MANNKIQIKRSSVAGRVPTAEQLAVGEFAVNLTDNRLFTKDASNTVIDVLGQSLNTTANVSFSQANIGNVVTTHVSSANSLLLSSGTTDSVVIGPNGANTQFLPSGQIRPAGVIMGSSYDSNQVDVTYLGPLQLKGMAYGVDIVTSPDNGSTSHAWTFGTDGNTSAPGNVTANGTITANTFVGNVDWSYVTSKPDLKIDITGDATGNQTFTDLANGSISITLANTAVTAGTYGNSSVIPVITVDSKGRVTSATTNAVAGITGYSYTSANNTFAITAGDGSVYRATINTVNTLSVSNTLTVTGIGTFSNDVSVTGNLTVLGVTTFVNTTELNIGDNIITLNANTSGSPTLDAGIEIARGTSSNVSLIWSETNDRWMFTEDGINYARLIGNTEFDTAVLNIVTAAAEGASNAYSNAVATASTDATNKAANAYSNAISYADAKASNAYSNAVSFATTAAAEAYSNATSYADVKASNAYSNAVSYTDAKAANAYSNAVSTAATDASDKAANAYSNAVSFATAAANAAYSNAVSQISSAAATAYSNAAAYADTAAATAYANAYAAASYFYSTGASYTNVMANNAYNNAASYADTKASTAYSNAVTFATSAAANAYSNATSYADTVATTAYNNAVTVATNAAANAYANAIAYSGNAAAAYANAVAYAASNTYVNNTFAPKSSATFAGLTTIGGIASFTGNVEFSSNTYIYANGTVGTAGQVLTSSGPSGNLYWSTVASGGGGANLTLLAATGGIHYFPMSTTTTGAWSNGEVDSSLKYNPTSKALSIDEGLIALSETGTGNTLIYGNKILLGFGSNNWANISGQQTAHYSTNSTATVNANSLYIGNASFYATVNSTAFALNGVAITGGGGGNAFGTIAVSGQNNVIADQSNDVLTFVAGNNMVITTSDTGDTITFSSTGGGSGSVGNSAGNAFIAGRDNFVGDGTTTAFTLSQTGSANSILVLVEGLVQFHSEDYGVVGTTLTFTSAPANNEAVEVLHISGASTYHIMQYGAIDTFTGDGYVTDYTLSVSANTSTATVYLDGLLQAPTTDFTLSGTTLSFTSAPLDGEVVLVYHTESISSALPGLAIAGTDTFAGDGTTSDFTLTSTADINTSLVTVNGIVQRYGVDYSIAGLTLSFTDAPPDDSAIQAMRFAGSVGTAYRNVAVGSSTITAEAADSTLTFANTAGVSLSVSGSTVTVGLTNIDKQSLAGNGSNTVFTLTHITTADDIFVYVNGIYFHPDEDYTVTGSTITFTTAPEDTSDIRIRFMRAPGGLASLLGDLSSGSGSYDMSSQDGPPIDLNA